MSVVVQAAPSAPARRRLVDRARPPRRHRGQDARGYAPGFGELVEAREVITPATCERDYGLTGGDVHHAEPALDQFFAWRPLLGEARYAYLLEGLYLAGSGAHPGGGITGGPGANAADRSSPTSRRADASPRRGAGTRGVVTHRGPVVSCAAMSDGHPISGSRTPSFAPRTSSRSSPPRTCPYYSDWHGSFEKLPWALTDEALARRGRRRRDRGRAVRRGRVVAARAPGSARGRSGWRRRRGAATRGRSSSRPSRTRSCGGRRGRRAGRADAVRARAPRDPREGVPGRERGADPDRARGRPLDHVSERGGGGARTCGRAPSG